MQIVIVEDGVVTSIAVDGDERREDPARLVEAMMVRQELQKALDMTGKRYATILRLRHGLNPERPGQCLTLEQVGRRLRISRERVRQLEEQALLRLRRIVNRMGLISVPEFRSF